MVAWLQSLKVKAIQFFLTKLLLNSEAGAGAAAAAPAAVEQAVAQTQAGAAPVVERNELYLIKLLQYVKR